MWCDKYKPHSIKNLSYHPKLSYLLQKLALSGEFPHLLFYGQSGSGKKTRIMALLHEIFGPRAQKVHFSKKYYEVKKIKKTIEISMLNSPFHVKFNPSDAGIHDKIIVQDVIKNMASVYSFNTKFKFKILVLEEIDKLTKDAQHGLRRTMEKYMENCRLILCCKSISKVIEPLRSRCLLISVPSPTSLEIKVALLKVIKAENIPISQEFVEKIIKISERNLRRAFLMLQMNYQRQTKELKIQKKVIKLPWQIFLDDICDDCCREQKPETINKIRLKFYELICNCISPNIIITQLTFRLMSNVDDQLKTEIAYWAAFHEQRLYKADRPVLHLIAFIARFMQIYKRWADEFFKLF